MRGHPAGQFEAVHFRHADIANENIHRLARKQFPGRPAVIKAGRRMKSGQFVNMLRNQLRHGHFVIRHGYLVDLLHFPFHLSYMMIRKADASVNKQLKGEAAFLDRPP